MSELMTQGAEIVPASHNEITPMQVLQMAVANNADIDKLTALMELQERFEANQARKSFNAAMSRFKENPPKITKNKNVEYDTAKGKTKYSHATLDHANDLIIAALSAVGISHKWKPKQDGLSISITCVLTHSMGHSEETTLSSAADDSGGKNSIQAIASAVTYLERYTLLAAVGLAAGVDDDGRAAARLPDEEFENHIAAIKGAKNLRELQKAFAAAYKAADEGKSPESMKGFIAAKEAKKKELGK